jgi:DNA topoisomerase-1
MAKAADSPKKNLVIVESPAKAKTIRKFLGSHYKIEASMGHVRDLPRSQMGIDVENDFEPKYITIRGKGELLAKLRKEAKDAKTVYLATDPDREGEAISWHLTYALGLDPSNTKRITFNEITKGAVTKSIKEARAIEMKLVDAQQARRALDRIIGYNIGPLLWKKVKKGLSAGRVQSVALRLICDRDDEINAFTPEEYWTVEAELSLGGERFVSAYDGELKNEAETAAVLKDIKGAAFTADEIKRGTRVRKPAPPFTTSTLQQEASKQLGFAAQKTMFVAQQLYEGVDVKDRGSLGLVSYIRTDSTRVSDEAYGEADAFIKKTYGADYGLPEKPVYKTKGRAQDAHEAVRPSYPELTPDALKPSLTRDQHRLYQLIWERFIASNMAAAVYDTMSVKLDANGRRFKAGGSVLRFEGYKKAYKRDDDADAAKGLLPGALREGAACEALSIDHRQHFTQPPPRFTEAALVKTLEENGVGRPSTYAPTIATIVSRGYVSRENKAFFPTELGEVVNDIMKENFQDIVDVEFTAKMERDLDAVEDGGVFWKEVLRRFYAGFKGKIALAESRVENVEVKDEVTDVICENCGRNMVVKMGRFGRFLACPGFPECRNAKPLFEEAGVACPVCGGKVYVKKTKKGRRYYGCERNPECGFMSWAKPTGELCPECGRPLVEKGGKEKAAACSACRYKKEAGPADEDDIR